MAVVELHIHPDYPLYCAEADARKLYYHPPHIYGWLYYDGDRHGTINYATWRPKILGRMAEPAPVTITMWGDYNSSDGSGTIFVQYRNDSTASITGRALLVVTEDSIYFTGPNLDSIHNHVARDYLPDQDGSIITVAAGDSVVVSESFTIQPGWNESQCEIVAWIQNDSIYADSTREVWQGGMIKVMELIGTRENESLLPVQKKIHTAPNPCTQGIEFIGDNLSGIECKILIYDVSGRVVDQITGKKFRSLYWNLHDQQGQRVSKGVYIYQFIGENYQTSGTIIVE